MGSQKSTLKKYKWKWREKERQREWRNENPHYYRDKMRQYRARQRKLYIADVRIEAEWNPEDTFTKKDLEYINEINNARIKTHK